MRIIKGLREGGLGSADSKGLRGALRQSQAGRGERDAVESRKLKVESQPKRRRIYRPEKLGAGADAKTGSGQAPDTEITQRWTLRSGAGGKRRANGGRGRS